MPLAYQSGEPIRKGDRVTYHGEEGEIELVVDPESTGGTTEERWHLQEHGGGVLIREPKVFGLVFIPTDQIGEDEDLVFISRAARSTGPQIG